MGSSGRNSLPLRVLEKLVFLLYMNETQEWTTIIKPKDKLLSVMARMKEVISETLEPTNRNLVQG